MGAFIMPAVGMAAQYFNQKNANARGQRAQVGAIANQNAFRNTANTDVTNQTNNIANSSPAPIANAENANFVNTLRNNVGQGTKSALAPTPGASKRYASDAATAGAATQSFGDTQAGQVSALDAALRQRQNEGLQMQTLGTNLNTINAASQKQNYVDQLRAQAVSQPNPWVSLFSKVMMGGGHQLALNNGGDGTPIGQGGYLTSSGALAESPQQ